MERSFCLSDDQTHKKNNITAIGFNPVRREVVAGFEGGFLSNVVTYKIILVLY